MIFSVFDNATMPRTGGWQSAFHIKQDSSLGPLLILDPPCHLAPDSVQNGNAKSTNRTIAMFPMLSGGKSILRSPDVATRFGACLVLFPRMVLWSTTRVVKVYLLDQHDYSGMVVARARWRI